MIVIYFLILILIILFLYLKVQNEYFNSVPVDTIDSVSKHECYLIIEILYPLRVSFVHQSLETGTIFLSEI